MPVRSRSAVGARKARRLTDMACGRLSVVAGARKGVLVILPLKPSPPLPLALLPGEESGTRDNPAPRVSGVRTVYPSYLLKLFVKSVLTDSGEKRRGGRSRARLPQRLPLKGMPATLPAETSREAFTPSGLLSRSRNAQESLSEVMLCRCVRHNSL